MHVEYTSKTRTLLTEKTKLKTDENQLKKICENCTAHKKCGI